jgi:hypothetical protein
LGVCDYAAAIRAEAGFEASRTELLVNIQARGKFLPARLRMGVQMPSALDDVRSQLIDDRVEIALPIARHEAAVKGARELSLPS